MELSLDTSGAVAASTSTTVDGQIILPTPSGQESLDDDSLLRSWTLPDGEEEEDAMLAEKDGDDGFCGGD